ncbi:MAG TPA: hypothetical protein PKC54_15885 [Ferruginibacter sp.]|nr:hypothetical protein [Ferruginibacter sp.]
MKRSISFILITGFLLMAGGNVAAQNAAPDGKPMKATLKQDKEISTAPPVPKLQTSNEQTAAKPIVPGGEVTQPKDTRVPLNDKDNASPKTLKRPVVQETPQPAAPAKKATPAKEQQQQ